MPPVEAPPLEAARHPTIPQVRTHVTGWGGGPPAPVRAVGPLRSQDLPATLALARDRGSGAIARGMGRAYGDAAQLTDGFALDLTALKRFGLDREQGIVTAEAGITIGELLHSL